MNKLFALPKAITLDTCVKNPISFFAKNASLFAWQLAEFNLLHWKPVYSQA